MDAQYKMITKTAHLISKEISQEEANEMFATMSGLKEQLTKVGKYFKAWHSVRDQRCLQLTLLVLCHRGQIIYLLADHVFISYWDSSSSNFVVSFKNETMELIPSITFINLELLVAVF